MERWRRNNGVKLVFLLCLLVQGLLLFPHHHHHGATAACFNTWHCTANHHHDNRALPFHNENDGCCDHNHAHENTPCSHLGISTLPSRQHLVPEPGLVIFHAIHSLLPSLPLCQECLLQHDECLITKRLEECPPLRNLFLIYSTKALPSRAGTFIA